MPRRCLSQKSFFDPQFVSPGCLVPGTTPWMLANFRHRLFPTWLTSGWRGEGRLGRNAWPAPVLLTLLMLRWSGEGMSRLGSVKRARTDLEWRAAMGIACDVEPPCEKTVREFESFMRERHPVIGTRRYQLLHEHIVRLALEHGIAGEAPLWAMDSTPMWCYGDVLDTVRLLGDGLRQLGTRWARATRTTVSDVARLWNMPLLQAKSTKGHFKVDWRKADALVTVIPELAESAQRVVAYIRAHLPEARRSLRKGLLHRCANLMRVIRDDLETDKRGHLVIAERVTHNRLISLTDPQARHGRKSAKKLFNGFKLHLLGDLVSGLFLSVTVTCGSDHDSVPAHRLIRRAQDLIEKLHQVLGDTAYGGSMMRKHVQRSLNIDLLTPPVSEPKAQEDKNTRSQFTIDFKSQTATCPNGVMTREYRIVQHPEHKVPTHRYMWPHTACSICPIRDGCRVGVRTGHRLLLHPLEQELREHRAAWLEQSTRDLYRRRGECERLVNETVRHGGRKARSWGLSSANYQGHAIVVVCNMRLLARKLYQEEVELLQAKREIS